MSCAAFPQQSASIVIKTPTRLDRRRQLISRMVTGQDLARSLLRIKSTMNHTSPPTPFADNYGTRGDGANGRTVQSTSRQYLHLGMAEVICLLPL